MFSIIFKNLLGFDMFILLLACVNGALLYPMARKATWLLKNQLQPTLYVPIQVLLASFQTPKAQAIDLHLIKRLRDKEAFYVNLLLTVNSIFPLMGILGTIISLLRMVDISSPEVMMNFTTALTSTFWGLIFAIAFKAVDATVVMDHESNEESFQLLIKRIDTTVKVEDVHETA